MMTYIRQILIAVVLLTAAWGAVALKPTKKINANDKFSLEQIIPKKFGDWQVDPTIIPVKPDPETERKLAVLYDQTLSRTYVNTKGERIMLSIAYGGDQSNNLQVHKPEVCYTAQGFEVTRNVLGQMLTEYGQLPIKRLMAVQGPRNEPITYWITVGDKVIQTGVQRRLQALTYGLTGRVPDGMLVRVSNIDTDLEASYKLQDEFVNSMLRDLDAKSRSRLIGTFGA
ncbi:exosortase-associated protein EpsI, B-type [Massilia sp. W12]|uniref:exosortase-associated protein EpsI, B-type n=1 Tax=Massilia sp. W12 TaxID=3126507 RepID=UPI0030CAA1F4